MRRDKLAGSIDALGLDELRRKPCPTCGAKARKPCTVMGGLTKGTPMLTSVHGKRE